MLELAFIIIAVLLGINLFPLFYTTVPKIGASEHNVFLILPHQLFKDIPSGYNEYYIIEHPNYFTKFKFHKLKLILHRAAMKYYEDYLKSKSLNVKYIEFNHQIPKFNSAVMYDPIDDIKIDAKYLPSPYFLNSKTDLSQYRKITTKFRHDQSFYPWMLKRFNLNYTVHDAENRKPLPDGKEPITYSVNSSEYVNNAIEYINKYFPDNPGQTDHFIYPVTHTEANKHLKEFIKRKLDKFGDYQDAVRDDVEFGYHSVISSSLNCGLLTPKQVLNAINKTSAPMNSKEGFIRQVIGWREYCQLLYVYGGSNVNNINNTNNTDKPNYFNSQRKLAPCWWDGTTGLKPIDNVIGKVLKYAYAHHNERLMILSSVMTMLGVHPTEMYNWFMCFVSIDAYDWVMVPNIYGMGSFADGGKMMTRPYFSSGGYIAKMTNYKDEETINLWTALFYNFISENKIQLKKNYFSARYIPKYEKKPKELKQQYKKLANQFIQTATK